jgi:hypothetical protein
VIECDNMWQQVTSNKWYIVGVKIY